MGVFRSFGAHLAQRAYAFGHGLFRSQDAKETAALYDAVAALAHQHNVSDFVGWDTLVRRLTAEAIDGLDISVDPSRCDDLSDFARALFHFERLFILPEIDWNEKRSTSQWWALRDALIYQKSLLIDFAYTTDCLCEALSQFFRMVDTAAPQFLAEQPAANDLSVDIPLIHGMSALGETLDHFYSIAANSTYDGLFNQLRAQLERNIISASGGNPDTSKGFSKTPVTADKSAIKDPHELVSTYLAHTPLLGLLDHTIRFSIPLQTRFEHHHIIAGSGHGKTQTLQYLIAHDLEAVAADQRSIIVLDSQGDLIRNIARLEAFAPGGPLHDRVVIIDPTDVEYPVSLNLFDVGVERLNGYAPLERERLTNSILELYDFVLGTLLAAEMTQKQNVIFRYVTRLMLHIPNATIHTLRELMEPDSHLTFAPHIAQLEGSARHFFESEFTDKEFAGTRKQVLRRLWGILENQTFERMFSHPTSKLDLFSEMNAGKVILINTAKDLLKETGTQIFGRFFIALIAQAAQERATLPAAKRIPTLVYIDEAQDYFDRNIGLILAQARKYNVGMVLAHQYLGQLDPKLQDAFAANTAIKFAGGVSAKDARLLAPMLNCEAPFITAQGKGGFASFIRGETKSAVPLSFPLGYLERKPVMNAAEQEQLRDQMRERYAVHHSALTDPTTPPESTEVAADATEPSEEPPSKDTDPPAIDLTPGKEW